MTEKTSEQRQLAGANFAGQAGQFELYIRRQPRPNLILSNLFLRRNDSPSPEERNH